MPDETLPPPPPPPPPPATPPPPPSDESSPPPPGPALDVLPPPKKPTKIALFAEFSGGCIITLLLAFLLAIVAFGSGGGRQLMGCAAVQLVWVIPGAILLFRGKRGGWATGVLFGGALVFLFASICGEMGSMH